MEQFETASEKISIVTGYGGIAYETALALAVRGDTVIMAGRDPVKGAAAVKKVQDAVAQHQNIIFEPIDLFEPDSIRSFAERIIATYDRIDTIMCIAGVMMSGELSLTSEGVERQFAVNYLGHYELVGRLMPLLMKSDDPRVVTVSSVANRPARFDLRDATGRQNGTADGVRSPSLRGASATRQSRQRGAVHASLSYALSKLCCLMYAVELSRRNPKIKACCVHPGFAKTQLFNRSKGFTMRLLQGIFFVLPFIRQSARAAAKPAIFAATSPNAKSGAYYGPLFTIMGLPRRALMPARAKNPRLREELWTLSERLSGVKYESTK